MKPLVPSLSSYTAHVHAECPCPYALFMSRWEYFVIRMIAAHYYPVHYLSCVGYWCSLQIGLRLTRCRKGPSFLMQRFPQKCQQSLLVLPVNRVLLPVK